MKEGPAPENRKLIFDYVSVNPGSHLRKIERDLKVCLGTLRYHLDYLEKKGSIVSQKQNNQKIYFVSGLKPPEKTLTQVLQQKHFRNIILVLIESPGLTFLQITDRVSMSNPTASKYIKLLINKEIISYKKFGREKKYYINDEKSIIELLKTYKNFMADMSYELRTHMNAVIGFSSLLPDDNLTPEQREYIEGIRKGGEDLLTIINDTFDLPRSVKDNIVLERQPFSLRHCIDESLDMVAVQASKKGLNLSQTINYGTRDTIVGDHGRLRQILVNLLSNAVKFTEKGDVSVSVSSKPVEGNSHQIYFKIKDTGVGIPKEKKSVIFEPLTQVERTISRKRDGVGLGLAITKNLVELMGGTIWAESTPGQGATFSFMIPAEIIPGKQPDFGRMDRGTVSERLPVLKPMHILVAEDNPSNQRVLVEMLKRLGYRADAVADGHEVVQALERQDYDLVLMDIKMPEMDGITATQEIRKLRLENRPKIVAITAFALNGDREKCLEAGMDDYIAKPVLMGDLAEVLKRCSLESQ